jgi:glutamate synthase (NADPH/NADH) large chain
MTNGMVVVLGEVGRNFAAGMSGGEAYVYDPEGLLDLRLNGELVSAAPVTAAAELRRLVERHARYAASARAAQLLDDWETAVTRFRRVAPKANVARIEEEHEGTLGGGGAEADAGEAVSA